MEIKIKYNIILRRICTCGFDGFVENLSLLSPSSSYSITTLSIVTTAILVLFGDQAKEVTLQAPSFIKQKNRQNNINVLVPHAPIGDVVCLLSVLDVDDAWMGDHRCISCAVFLGEMP